MSDFRTLTTPTHIAESRFSIEVPDGWQQGRGAFGGFGIATLIRAIETTENVAERPLRSLTSELFGPLLPGPADVVVELLRRGAGMTTVAARIIQDESVVAHAVGILARPRMDQAYNGIKAPDRKPFHELAAAPSMGPSFAQFFEYRIAGNMPFSQQPEALVETWVRMRLPCPTADAAYIAAMADATWPALFTTMSEPRPMGTVSYTLSLFGPFDDVRPDAPLYHRGRVLAAADGYAAETRELWTPEGRLVSINHQTIATIR